MTPPIIGCVKPLFGFVKPLFVVCGLAVALLGIAASCGPQQSFCPNNPPLYNCYNSDGGSSSSSGTGGTGSTVCPDGGSQIFMNGAFVCM